MWYRQVFRGGNEVKKNERSVRNRRERGISAGKTKVQHEKELKVRLILQQNKWNVDVRKEDVEAAWVKGTMLCIL